MNGLFDQLFGLVLLYGYPVIGGAELASSIGAPIPATAILLLAGSLAAVGSLNLFVLIAVVAVCGVLGDCIDFFIGRAIGRAASGGTGRRRYLDRPAVKRAHELLMKWSWMGVFLSRWLFTPVCAVTSVVAGASGYPLHGFLTAVVAGELVSAVLYVGVGYLVGASWPEIWSFLSGIPGLATVAAVGLVCVGFGVVQLVGRRGGRRAVAAAPVPDETGP